MTVKPGELVIRPIAGPAELGLFCQLPYALNDEIAGDLEAGHRRPHWLWMALSGGRLLARAAWWARRGNTAPQLLDIFDLDDESGITGLPDIGARLLREAAAAVIPPGTGWPEYIRFVPSDWRAQEGPACAVRNRMDSAERTGASLFVERLRLEWSPGTPIPPRSGRLSFRPVTDEGELIELMTAVTDGTLDAHSRRDLARMPAAAAAAKHYAEELALYRSPREWWQVAELPGGGPAGFVIPADNGYSPIIAYIGVLPGHRGNGYIAELLAEGTRILAAAGVPRIRASTDLGNAPMAAAFRRAGWRDTGHQIDMTWD